MAHGGAKILAKGREGAERVWVEGVQEGGGIDRGCREGCGKGGHGEGVHK